MEEKIDEIEIIKREISLYFHRVSYHRSLCKKQNLIFYELSGLKGIDYSKQKIKNPNYRQIEERKIELLEKIDRLEEKIKKEEKEIKKIERTLKTIDAKNKIFYIRKEKIKTSEIVLNILCSRISYDEALKKYGFSSKSAAYRYVSNAIENILE